MSDNTPERNDKKLIRNYLGVMAVLVCVIGTLWFNPGKVDATLDSIYHYLLEVMLILPAVMVIMGIFSVYVSKDLVLKHLGETSGIKGIALALFFGSLPTGPLYIAFPVAVTLREKGARTSNLVIFLSAWACIKMPQELVELHFLGPAFMASRLTLTIIFVVLMGYAIERIIGDGEMPTP